jgi:hypothetical protein
MRASLRAMAVMALGVPRRVLQRRKQSPIESLLCHSLWAAALFAVCAGWSWGSPLAADE